MRSPRSTRAGSRAAGVASLLLIAICACGGDPPPPAVEGGAAAAPLVPAPAPAGGLVELSVRLGVPFPPGASHVRTFDRATGLDVVLRSGRTLDELVSFFGAALDPLVGSRFRSRLPEVGKPWGERRLAGAEYRMATWAEADGRSRIQVTLLREERTAERQITIARLPAE